MSRRGSPAPRPTPPVLPAMPKCINSGRVSSKQVYPPLCWVFFFLFQLGWASAPAGVIQSRRKWIGCEGSRELIEMEREGGREGWLTVGRGGGKRGNATQPSPFAMGTNSKHPRIAQPTLFSWCRIKQGEGLTCGATDCQAEGGFAAGEAGPGWGLVPDVGFSIPCTSRERRGKG